MSDGMGKGRQCVRQTLEQGMSKKHQQPSDEEAEKSDARNEIIHDNNFGPKVEKWQSS